MHANSDSRGITPPSRCQKTLLYMAFFIFYKEFEFTDIFIFSEKLSRISFLSEKEVLNFLFDVL